MTDASPSATDPVRPQREGDLEMVLKMLGELWSLTAVRVFRSGAWRYRIVSDDHSADLLDEPATIVQSDEVGSFDELLDLLDAKCWWRYTPVFLHKELREQIIEAAFERFARPGESRYFRWQSWDPDVQRWEIWSDWRSGF